MASTAILFDGNEFYDKNSLALYLKNNFRKSIAFLNDDSLYHLLQNEFPDIYAEVIDLSKDYLYKENIITLIIYLLDNSLGVITPNNAFVSTYDIADMMKKTYPNINEDIEKLLHDKVLSHIFLSEFQRTNDTRYKRNYTFMLKVNENIEYDFTYYYFLFIHLAKNEVVRFTLDGVKMKSLSEITVHLSNNIDRSHLIIGEILRNPFILALMAVESGIDQVTLMLSSKNSLEILKVLSTYSNVNLSKIIQQKMSYWLLINYHNYEYETDEAKALYQDYQNITSNLDLNSLNDYVAIYDEVKLLYDKFVKLFNYNRLISFRKGINGSDDYYLSYRLNDELVCKKFLIENDLYSDYLYTDIHQETIERELLVDALESEKNEITEFRNEVSELTKEIHFDNKFLRRRLFISYMYLILEIISLFGGLLLGLDSVSLIDWLIDLSIFAILGISIVLTIVAIVKYSKKLSNSFLVELALDSSIVSINEIKQEQNLILNPDNKNVESPSLINASYYQKNRRNDLFKIQKIAKKKTNVSNLLLICVGVLSILPIFEFGLKAFLMLFEQMTFEMYLNNVKVNILNFGFMAIQLVLLSIFRKRHIFYYFIYIYLVILAVTSFVIF